MSRSEIGLLLRLAGPLVQVVCLVLLFGTTLGRSKLMGVGVDRILFGGFLFGLALVAFGLLLSARTSRSR